VASCRPPSPVVPSRIDGTIPLVLYNPYSLPAEIELKCRLPGKAGRIRPSMAQILMLPGKSSVILRVPEEAVRCELWPKVKLWH